VMSPLRHRVAISILSMLRVADWLTTKLASSAIDNSNTHRYIRAGYHSCDSSLHPHRFCDRDIAALRSSPEWQKEAGNRTWRWRQGIRFAHSAFDGDEPKYIDPAGDTHTSRFYLQRKLYRGLARLSVLLGSVNQPNVSRRPTIACARAAPPLSTRSLTLFAQAGQS